MDIDGLAKLMGQNRDEMIRQFNEMKEHCCKVTESCNKRLLNIEKRVDEHSTSPTRIKSIGLIIAFLWTSAVSFVTKSFGNS